MCGEQEARTGLEKDHAGSPPRVRGTGRIWNNSMLHSGITPACAGNSFAGRDTNAKGKDHPRVCGEQNMKRLIFLVVAGSPPRVRGTVDQIIEAHGETGITPACAGNSYPEFLPAG